ncbi:DNA ligase 1-like [Benincasa hispida]|uniref:DNA ligase 1-like n=1 Tax=Benincasa hispida TaxID=102211 RepID=UPI0019021288|nr:DNA ligase 1-like [Benincasa hispida]
MEKEEGLPEAGVVNQPLSSEEAMEEELGRRTLAILDPKETANAKSYEGPIRVTLKEVAAEKRLERAKEKKKKKKNIREKGDEEEEEAKLKKEKERSGRKESKREERRLKKEEERRKRAESPELDGESTSVREDKGESAQLRESAQHEIPQTIAIDEGEDVEITPLTRHRKENTLQGSTIDPPILIDALEEQERRRKEEEEK